MQKKCTNCGILFYCLVDDIENCWCFKMPIKAVYLKIKDCICKICLKKREKKDNS